MRLHGNGASPGSASGIAVKVADPSRPPVAPSFPFVLITPFSTPFLFELLLKAEAVATEHGGATSHAATLSRELGKPCVVGVQGLLGHIDGGESVTVNGSTGHVDVARG